MIALPSLMKSPPRAGKKASASGTECQCEGSWLGCRSALLALGSNKSSVDDLIDCLVLSTDSEKVELRLCRRGGEGSAKVDALPNCLFLIGDRLWVAVLFAIDFGTPFDALIVRSC